MNSNHNNPRNNNHQNNRTPTRHHVKNERNHHQQQQPQQQQLPMSGIPFGCVPAFLPGSASLVEQLDRRIMIVLRDGRHLVGILRSFDQFSNMVLEETSERRVLLTKKDGEVVCFYTDILLGLYMVRGDSMVLLGEVDTDEEENEVHESVVTAGHNSAVATDGLTGSGLLMGDSIEKQQAKKHMIKVSLKEFEAMEMKVKETEDDQDLVEELTWEFDLDLVV